MNSARPSRLAPEHLWSELLLPHGRSSSDRAFTAWGTPARDPLRRPLSQRRPRQRNVTKSVYMNCGKIAFLRERGIKLGKRYGQHLLVDERILQRMVEYGEVSKRDVVLEIGAGLGGLTRLLARRAKRVIAVERDPKMVELLRENLRRFNNVEIFCSDALCMEFPFFNKVVSNLPYSISSDITFRLLKYDFDLGVMMYQLEFAKRLFARVGSEEYSRLTVNAFYRAHIELLEEVSPMAFYPRPRIRSAIVKIVPRAKPPFEVENEEMFFRVVRALFQHRKQKVRNALYHSFTEIFPDTSIQKGERKTILSHLPKELAEARVVELPPEKLGEISNLLMKSSVGGDTSGDQNTGRDHVSC